MRIIPPHLRSFCRNSVAVFGVLLCALACGCSPRQDPERLSKLRASVPQAPAKSHDAAGAQPLPADTVPVVTHRAELRTSKGTITIDLYGHDAPRAVENFVTLAKRRFFSNIAFHRIAKNFVVQTGDPKTKDPRKKDEWGAGGESVFGESFADELNPDAPSYKNGYKRGAVAAANRGPDTNTSQFFICLRDAPELLRQHTIFGAVSQGMDVVDSIAAAPIQPVLSENDGRPLKPVLIRSVRVAALKR